MYMYYIYMYTYVHIYTYIYIHVQIYKYMYEHKHKRKRSSHERHRTTARVKHVPVHACLYLSGRHHAQSLWSLRLIVRLEYTYMMHVYR